LAKQGTEFKDLDVDTPWIDVLKDLGFKALQIGKLLKLIKAKFPTGSLRGIFCVLLSVLVC
jgi:hypothetical protein